MRLLRSWPAQVPPGRAYVQDDMDRLVIDGYRYDTLADIDDDIVLVEWDIAVDGLDLERFIGYAKAQPDRVLVAPYRLHITTVRGVLLPTGPKWVHRYDTNRHVEEGDPFCHWFGLGLAYLPRELVQAFTFELRFMQERFNQWTEGFNDSSFSMWHWRVIKQQVPICWDVRPVHLHYQLPSP